MQLHGQDKSALVSSLPLLAVLIYAFCGAVLQGQSLPEPTTVAPADAHPYTLHVYRDLIEIPTLVLNRSRRSYPGLHPEDFSLRLDGGQAFAPRHLRVEGDDPLNLSFLLDLRRGESPDDLVQRLDLAASQLPEDLLSKADRISVFAFDCNLVRSLYAAPASRSMLQSGFSALLDAKKDSDLRGKGGCRRGLQLWDAVGAMAHEMSGVPGRRVQIIFTDGVDRGSTHPWQDIRQHTDALGTTVFGIRMDPGMPPPESQVRGLSTGAALPVVLRADPFSSLCNGTGGLMLLGSDATVGPLILRIVELLRERYILDFPRPQNDAAGVHPLVVELTHDKAAIVRSAGVVVPLRKKVVLTIPPSGEADTTEEPSSAGSPGKSPSAQH